MKTLKKKLYDQFSEFKKMFWSAEKRNFELHRQQIQEVKDFLEDSLKPPFEFDFVADNEGYPYLIGFVKMNDRLRIPFFMLKRKVNGCCVLCISDREEITFEYTPEGKKELIEVIFNDALKYEVVRDLGYKRNQ